MRPGQPVQLESVNLDAIERLPANGRLDVEVKAAAVADDPLDRGKPPLPLLSFKVVAEAVLEENQPTGPGRSTR